MTLIAETPRPAIRGTETMRATVFHGPNDIRVEEVPRPHAGVGEFSNRRDGVLKVAIQP